jgi:hypothetical protein
MDNKFEGMRKAVIVACFVVFLHILRGRIKQSLKNLIVELPSLMPRIKTWIRRI